MNCLYEYIGCELKSSGKCLIPFVPFLFISPILFMKEQAQVLLSITGPPYCCRRVLSDANRNPFAAEITILLLTIPPLIRNFCIYSCTNLSWCPSFKGCLLAILAKQCLYLYLYLYVLLSAVAVGAGKMLSFRERYFHLSSYQVYG